MGLRPAKTCRNLGKAPWARYSKKVPKKSFVKAMPHLSLLVYKMGDATKTYEKTFDYVAQSAIQLRDNALESARQAANKYLEKVMPMNYLLTVRVYPHNVIRENKMIAGAGADRLQKGMRKSFGRATDRAARIFTGQPIFTVKCFSANEAHIKEAFRRAKSKLSGEFKLVSR
jgi:large subunit ribosomal protein L10e